MTRNTRFISAGIFLLVAILSSKAGAQLPDNQIIPAKVDAGGDSVEVLIPTVDGTLVWKDVAGSLAESLSLDAPTLERMFPTGSLDLRAPSTILVLFGINMALGDAISIKMATNDNGQPALRFRCDRKTLGMLAPQAKANEPAGIQIDDDWKERSAQKPLVVFFHGLKSRPAKFDDFRTYLCAEGYATAAISYDDHQSITDSATQISQIAAQMFVGPNTPELFLVGHSMGGLVAREWTENPTISNDKIVSLVTIGTPHRGSNWASLPPLLDLFATGSLDSQDLVDVILHKPSAPGVRELAPESKFLTDMQARPRKAGVSYTTIVGTGSPVAETEVVRLRQTLQSLDQEGSVLRLIRPRIQPLLQSFDELARGKGDGVVAVDRATIAGEDDIVTVELSHIDMVSRATTAPKQPVWEAVLNRLKK